MEKYRTPNFDMITPDSELFCYDCKMKFGLLSRKTKCRACNHAFCNDCCTACLTIPGKKDKTTYFGFSYLTFETDKFKCCKPCINRIFNMIKVERLIDFFSCNAFLDMKDFMNLSLVCKNWYQACKFFTNRFNQIKYFHPQHKYDKIDIQLLRNNAFLIKHNLEYQIHLYKCIGRDAICYMKSREISKPLEHLHIINMIPVENIPKELYSFILFWLRKFDKTSILAILPLLVHYLDKNLYMVDLLLDKCEDMQFAFDFYNFSEQYITKNPQFWNEVRSNITKKNPNISKSFNFLKQLLKASGKDTNDFSFSLVNMLKDSLDSKVNIWLPFQETITDFMISDIKISDSATAPVVLPYKNKQSEIKSLLLKKDNVLKDNIVMSCINIIDTILKRELNIDFGIITYKVIPIGKEGIIQMVNNSHTIYNIKEKLHFSIQNFIIEKNKNETIDSLRTRFMKSCAAYCVITYLFGIGDRHYENIMITEKGHLFHIDYGFILGSDPKPLAPEMKITEEMVDAMGGQNSEYYTKFKSLCNDIYNVLRKYTNIFIHMLSILEQEDIPKIAEKVIQRFLPGSDVQYASLQLYSNMESSVRSINIEDFLHYHSKNKTISKFFRFWK